MSSSHYHLRSSDRHGRLNEYGQPQRQNYGEDQPRESNSRSGDIQGTHQYGPDRRAMSLPPLNRTDSIGPSPRPTNNNPRPPVSSFLKPPAQHPLQSAQASSISCLRPPAKYIPAAHLYPGTTSQPQHYPASEPRIREASYPPSDTQRFQESGSPKYPSNTNQQYALKHKSSESEDIMQPSTSRVPTSKPRTPLPSYRGEKNTEECLLPTCKTRISKDASFGACASHRDQLSTWDFSYCEAEVKKDKDAENYFPNGQCRNKKPSPINRWCKYHGKRVYRWREEFMASECMKDGKWFEGRNKGTARFPPGYGTSGAEPCPLKARTKARK